MRLALGLYTELTASSPVPAFRRVLSVIYRPVFSYLYNNPGLKMSLYQSVAMMKHIDNSSPEMNLLLSSLARIDGFGYFREELCGLVADRLADGSLSRVRARRIWDALSLYLGMSDSYNMSIRLALDYALREVSGV